MNDLFLKALQGKNTSSRPPIWIMRQAGRYMFEYRALRERFSFLQLCENPELIFNVTLLPIKAFDFDAAILFSDILLIAKVLGFSLRFEENVGPIIDNPLQSADDLRHLAKNNVKEVLSYVFQAIRHIKQELKVPLIGFAGAPFTIASYLIEGKATKNFKKTKLWMLKDPESFSLLLKILADVTQEYLKAQIDAGVDAVQLFDSWAHVLADKQFQEFCLPTTESILLGIKPHPVILFCRGSSVFARHLALLHPSAISLDWQCDIAHMRSMLGKNICLQGNLDPDILYSDAPQVSKEASSILQKMKSDPAFIFNLGHGIHPDTPRENVQALVECVHNASCI
jgi:uroporphyrinogen decarboxylase